MKLGLLRRRQPRGYRGALQAEVARSFESRRPADLPDEVLAEGDVEHRHEFQATRWDRARLGPSFCEMDEAEMAKSGVAFPMATYKELLVCSCGREIVRSQRALV